MFAVQHSLCAQHPHHSLPEDFPELLHLPQKLRRPPAHVLDITCSFSQTEGEKTLK